MKKQIPILYRTESECCGCSICCIICPTNSIKMIYNEKGFAYPVINVSTCVGCEKCITACVFKKRQRKKD